MCHRSTCLVGLLVVLVFAGSCALAAPPTALPEGLSTEDSERIAKDLQLLQEKVARLRADKGIPSPVETDQLADVQIFVKSVLWALRYESKLEARDGELLKKALTRGHQRADELAKGKQPWTGRKGRLVRGYQSAVDNSVQPFGLIVPEKYDANRPIRLDVVLHGSTRPTGLSELRFINRFDEGDQASQPQAEADYIELHPLGRVENCYRWAGETDVFEAIEAVCRHYKIDRDRIVLRGMSMGASGTWHLGLKHPDFFVALGPYCGYVDTYQFSQTPLPNFVRVGPLPPYQEKALHMLDSVDYAANAGIVPAIACMGEKDVFFQAHELMGKAMEKEGLKMVNLISPGTGHVIDPVTHKEQMRRIGEYAAKGAERSPRQLRFVTWTLKYSRSHWLQVLGLEEHYVRAELEAQVADDGSVDVKEPKNIKRFAILPPVLQKPGTRLRVGGTEVRLPARKDADPPRTVVVERSSQKWEYLGSLDAVKLEGKRPGLQGPIDDAFTTPFLCVRGTGKAWQPAVQQWSEANLRRFAYEWNRYFRGDLPIKDDNAVTEDDVRRYNLILFGDPGSNTWISKALPKLPIVWTRDELRVADKRYPVADHAPALIVPNPFAEGRYLVLNSGHTFHEKELASLNYLLFPRLGDWAVLKVGGTIPAKPSDPLEESVLQAGFFDELWRLPSRKAGE